MSTKLYDGIILDISQDDFWDAVSQIRENIENTFSVLNKTLTFEHIKQSYVESALRKYRIEQGTPIKDEQKDHGLFFNALRKWKDEKEEFFKNKLRCKVQIFEPLDDGRILGYIFTNNEQDYYENLLQLPFIQEFGYWNNTDKPEELSDEQWKNRYESWNTVLDRNYFITGTGVSIELPESKSRTFLMPDDHFLDELNEHLSDEKNSWRKALSIRLVSDIVLNKMMQDENSDVKNGSFSAMTGVIHSSMFIVSDSDVFPVSEIPELTLENLMARDTSGLEFPLIDERIINELVRKVEQDVD